jgi:hypothetical protein
MVNLEDVLRWSENRNVPGLRYINMELLKYACGGKNHTTQCMEYR